MQWQDSYNVGVEIIDNAHRRLFSIVRKLTDIMDNKDREKNRRACIEGIKYFKSYTLEHFTQEEAYMRSVGYSGYPAHVKLHSQLRDETIPALEQELVREDYSDESVAHFIGVCLSWLTVHIMVEDQAITGRVASRVRHHQKEEDKILQLANVISEVTEEIFTSQASLTGKYYAGGGMEKPLCFRLYHTGDDGGQQDVWAAFEERFVFHAAGDMLGIAFSERNNIVLSTMEELVRTMIRRIGFRLEEENQMGILTELEAVEPDVLEKLFKKNPPRYSLLLETEKGRFSLSM